MGQASNSFSDGMVKDINPINVPATALTDCKNGTILTYNGNELCLQNDMGNFGLKNCKLSPGYVPVGLKEYGGILYIVSYNPATDRTEIGSYPSTKVNARSDDGATLSETIKYIDWTQEEQTYTDLLKDYHIQVFTDKDPERWKINPGDRVKIEWDDDKRETVKIPETDKDGNEIVDKNGETIMKTITIVKPRPCQKTEFYIMDENRNLTNIDEYIQEHLAYKSSAMSEDDEVRWKIPGWLAVKLCFPDIDNFLINFTTGNSPNFKDDNASAELNINLKFRTLMSDGLYKGSGEEVSASVIYKIELDNADTGDKDEDGNSIFGKVTKEEETVIDPETRNEVKRPCTAVFENTPVNMPNGQYYFNTEEKSHKFTVKKGCRITVTATPYIGKVKYDKFEKKYTYTADATSFDENNVKIGNNYFTYTLSEDESELKVMFNTAGMANTVGARLEWGLSRLTGEANGTLNWTPIRNNIMQTSPDYRQVDAWEIAEDITTSFTINLDKYDTDFDEIADDKDKSGHNFKKIVPEDIYLLQFRIILDNKYFQNDNTKRLVIASKLMNGFNDAKYDEITFDRWFANYKKYVTGDISLDSPTCTVGNVLPKQMPKWWETLSQDPLKDGSDTFEKNDKYPQFIPKKWYDKITNHDPNTTASAEQEYTVTANGVLHNIILPHGPLWRFFVTEITTKIGNINKPVECNKFTGKLNDINGSVNVSSSASLSENIRVTLKNEASDIEMFTYDYSPIGEIESKYANDTWMGNNSAIDFDPLLNERLDSKVEAVYMTTYKGRVKIFFNGSDTTTWTYGKTATDYLYSFFRPDAILWPIHIITHAWYWLKANRSKTWIHSAQDASEKDFITNGPSDKTGDAGNIIGKYFIMFRSRDSRNRRLCFLQTNAENWSQCIKIANTLRKNIYCYKKLSGSTYGGFVIINCNDDNYEFNLNTQEVKTNIKTFFRSSALGTFLKDCANLNNADSCEAIINEFKGSWDFVSEDKFDKTSLLNIIQSINDDFNKYNQESEDQYSAAKNDDYLTSYPNNGGLNSEINSYYEWSKSVDSNVTYRNSVDVLNEARFYTDAYALTHGVWYNGGDGARSYSQVFGVSPGVDPDFSLSY